MTFLTTQRLTYADHSEEIRALTKVLDDIGQVPDLQLTVDYILGRLATLMTAQKATLSTYDPREERI